MTKNSKINENLLQLSNCIRFLSIDAVQKANSGHPGMPMGMADIATILFKDHLKFDPSDPDWIDRDRLVISNGHGSMLLYSCLYLLGYKDITLNDLKNFRQLGSPTAGHPEYGEIGGIETTTGPLSQGLANAVGMAIAEKKLSNEFGKDFIDHFTYVFAGDGCLMEGLSHESCSLAGHLKLNKLIMFFDNNSISIDGSTNLSTSDDFKKRFESYQWNYFEIDGHNFEQISKAISKAKNSNRPTVISCKTRIGFGSPNKEGKSSSHGSPLGEDEIILTREKLFWNYNSFEIPKKFHESWKNFSKKNLEFKKEWLIKNKSVFNSEKFTHYFQKKINKKLYQEIIDFKSYHFKEKTNCASRKSSEYSIELISKHIHNLIGGSADLTGSNNTKTKEMKAFNANDCNGNYIYYGVREHAMAAIMNGISLHGGLIPYGGTFLVFSDYCRPSIRLAAIMNIQVIYVMTHDSIGLGEDGPTHQPVEHLSTLRSIPNLTVIRPCDIIETIESWEIALNNNGPTILVLTRQNLKINQNKHRDDNQVKNGAYIIRDFENYDATILSSGSEIEIACEASEKLQSIHSKNVRVVSIPSFELFEKNIENYKSKILGKKPIFGIEAGIINGWEKYVDPKNFIGMKSFGASGPYKDLYKHFDITSSNLINMIIKNL